MTKIYLVTNCYGDPNKVYIGKTKSCRKSSHKRTYGEHISYDYIDETNSLNREHWEPLETYWIEQFRQWGFEVVNKRKKGGSGPEYRTEEFKRNLSHPFSDERKNNMKKPKPKYFGPLISESLKGRDISLWSEKIYTVERNKKISTSLKGRSLSPTHKENIGKARKGTPLPTKQKPTLQYDLKGNLIKEWDFAKQASIELGLNYQNINHCLLGKSKTAFGFIWKYK
jgi:hypothetical protein